ncbi:MAG: SRPBCC family protein [Gammaproteobacteria bacterium]|nr:SRPBCC family protein [Gammaproteobacteria bacterium]MDH5513186.1 SRPBCC family protein [Gammaproteobacteria bacterium]
MWRRATASLALVLWAAAATAATIEVLDTTHDQGRYTVSFEVVLDADRDKVWRIMTDYERLPRVSKLIVETRVLKQEDVNRHRVGVTLEACVLIFCKTVKRMVDIEAWPQTEILVTEVPDQSDFREGVERWRVAAEGTKTRLNYTAELVPDFFIPPLIGPPVVKYFLRREIRITALEVEALASHE